MGGTVRSGVGGLALLRIALVCVALAPGVGTAATPDSLITMRCKLALFASEGMNASAIRVTTTEGRVTLHGVVGSGAERDRAESVVKVIRGVREVRNLLQVVPPARRDAVKESDAELKKRLSAALEKETSLADSAIKVTSVHDGVVLLGGTASGLIDRMRALEIATLTPGVRRVTDGIVIRTAGQR